MATRGLTLLEVVVALAVLAVGITSLQRLVAGSVLAVGSDAALTRAMLAAESVLAEAAVHVPEPGHVEGDRPGPPPLHWTRDVTQTPHARLREVRVRVSSGREACELVEVMRVPAR